VVARTLDASGVDGRTQSRSKYGTQAEKGQGLAACAAPAKIHKAEVRPDARYNNVLVTRFINSLMHQGKKSTAERIFYGRWTRSRRDRPGRVSVLKAALNNVKPILEANRAA